MEYPSSQCPPMSIEAKKRLDALRSSTESRLQWCAEGIAHCESQLSKLAEAQAEHEVWLNSVTVGGADNDLEPPFSEEQLLEIGKLIPQYESQLNEYRDMASETREMLGQIEDAEKSLASMSLEDRKTVDRLFKFN